MGRSLPDISHLIDKISGACRGPHIQPITGYMGKIQAQCLKTNISTRIVQTPKTPLRLKIYLKGTTIACTTIPPGSDSQEMNSNSQCKA